MSDHVQDAKAEEYFAQLVHLGDPILRRPCTPVTDFGPAEAQAALLTTVVRAIQGAGLAANQFGIDRQIAVAEVRKTELFPDRTEHPLVVLINPEIVSYSDETELDWEGCFSIPGYLGLVPRSTSIVVRCHNFAGEVGENKFEGYIARVVQHEIDHLNGRVYVDRMESMSSFITRPNYLKFVLKRD